MTVHRVETTVAQLLAYCSERDWAGHDPFDALNSRVFGAIRVLDFKLARLVLTQAMKRSPINIRSVLLIPATQNPKALGLFLASLVKLSKKGVAKEQGPAEDIIKQLVSLRSPGTSYWCWGYSFPWQMRTDLVPPGSPNLVCTYFVADALLDAYECYRVPEYLNMAISAAEYILNELYWTSGSDVAGFSYPLASIRVPVHNANLLAAALLSRVYRATGETKFLSPALQVARYSARRQHTDGSWPYGEASSQGWIDNFHTGYNLVALRSIASSVKTDEFNEAITRGYEFYLKSFFRSDGAPKYFHNRTYPIDIHSAAQSIITLSTLRDLNPASEALAVSVFEWTMRHMWDDRGFFYYRVLRLCKIRTSYMRWAQAWMLLALSTLLSES